MFGSWSEHLSGKLVPNLCETVTETVTVTKKKMSHLRLTDLGDLKYNCQIDQLISIFLRETTTERNLSSV